MAAYNYTQPADPASEQTSYIRKTYAIAVYEGATGTIGLGLGPIPYVTRYSPSGSVSFLYIQTDRVLVTSAALTTASNYTILGTNAPTVLSVTFTAGKSHIRLTLSGALPTENSYMLKVAQNTFGDGVDSIYNISTAVPIHVDYIPSQGGTSQGVAVGTPVVS